MTPPPTSCHPPLSSCHQDSLWPRHYLPHSWAPDMMTVSSSPEAAQSPSGTSRSPSQPSPPSSRRPCWSSSPSSYHPRCCVPDRLWISPSIVCSMTAADSGMIWMTLSSSCCYSLVVTRALWINRPHSPQDRAELSKTPEAPLAPSSCCWWLVTGQCTLCVSPGCQSVTVQCPVFCLWWKFPGRSPSCQWPESGDHW